MAQYSKESPEYIANGHYRIDEVEYMSVWTFKNKYSGTTDNTTGINGSEGKELTRNCSKCYSTEPDFGGYNEIYVFPVDEIKRYYSIN